MNQYPEAAGHQNTATSIASAATVPAATLRSMAVEHLLSQGPSTPDECAEALGVSILSIRPRFTELKLKGMIEKTSMTRMNDSGKRASVWRIRTVPMI